MNPKAKPAAWIPLGLIGAIAGTSLAIQPATAAGVNVENQTVESQILESQILESQTVENQTPGQVAIPRQEAAPAATSPTLGQQVPLETTDQLPAKAEAKGPIQILSPAAGSLLDGPTAAVTIQSPLGEDIELRLNGQLMDEGLIGQIQIDPSTQLVKQTWHDLNFQSGTNTLSVHRSGELSAQDTVQIFRGYRPAMNDNAVAPDPQAIRIISPMSGSVVGQPATSVTVQAPLSESIELRANGRLIDSVQIGRTETDAALGVRRQTWYGVVLQEGENQITVHRLGERDPLQSISLQVRGRPTQIRLRTLESRIPADGRSVATIQGQLLDANQNRSTWDSRVTLHTTAGRFIGVDQNPDAPGFQVEAEDGVFTAQIQSDIQAGFVRVKAESNDLEGFHQFEFSTPLRKAGVLAGVVDFRVGRRGTNYFGSLRDFLPAEENNRWTADAGIAAFGTVSWGEWLITGAANSDRPLNRDCNGESGLFRTVSQNCDETLYPLYGDRSQTDVVAPSKDHVYLKFERTSPVRGAGSDYFLWGDYNTPEFNRSSQLFTGLGRDLHGFKGNYNLGNLQLTGIYGNDVEGFQRDTLAPDGTSGTYFLSRQLILAGSEEVYLELEELNRPGTVVARERLLRGADYDIDYDRGALIFRDPVQRTDIDAEGKVLVRRIVVTYGFESAGQETSVYGGRVQYNFDRDPGEEIWLAGSYFREDRGNQKFQLYGFDSQVNFGQDGLLVAEYARSENSLDYSDPISGEAYRMEVSGTLLDVVQGKAYLRASDTGFSNNATTSFVPGQMRYGASVNAKVSSSTSLKLSYDHEDNQGIAPAPLDTLAEFLDPGVVPRSGFRLDNSLTTLRAGVAQKIGKARLGVDWVHRDRQDRISGDRVVSDQISSQFKLDLTRTLSVRAYNDLTLSSKSDPIYPSRSTLGLDWRVHPSLTLSLNNTYLSGGQFKDDFYTSLDVKGSHTFSSDTTVRGELSLLSDRTMGGTLGIDQGIKLARGLQLDLSYERVFRSRFKTAAGDQFEQPFAVGSGALSLPLTNGQSMSAGISYTDNPDVQVNARIEHRQSDRNGSNTVVSANALGQFTRDLTGLFRFHQSSAANQKLSDLGITRDIKVGLAYRNPTDDTFTGLLRYEYRENPSLIPETLLLGRGTGSTEHLLAAEAIYAPTWRWEFYGKLGYRQSRTQVAEGMMNTSSVTLAQARATYRVNSRWDVSADARWIRQPSTGFGEVGLNAEVGYYLNPNIRLSAGYAFGDVNDRDLGNGRSADGPYVGVTLKLDNNLFKDFGFQKPPQPPAEPLNPVEAEKNPVSEEASRPGSALDRPQLKALMDALNLGGEDPSDRAEQTLKRGQDSHPDIALPGSAP
ncbi:TonB-dependent receptor [Lyngbya confervoides]|uniref:TonB-dependent receptor n=1 Tax=Lyngbya confervoides BDU141951 TaxID=1574623 RepID=A0ABD4T598_9CYAN|nr:TonB-dependent receptor [Lyngbya confervoides]MCM1983678.1 TonB-dependent receptor [Lyngbya confervoides BDU141951]